MPDITVLFRKSSGEVRKISPKGQRFDDRDRSIWGRLKNPSFPDGTELREELPDGELGPFRQLGFAKITLTPAEVRNATQAEIDTFLPAERDDQNNEDAELAKDILRRDPIFRKFMKALVDVLRVEINILRTEHNLPNRTLAQIRQQILDRVSRVD